MEIPAQKHAGMTIFIPVIPASEPGSHKQSGSAQIVFYGDPRSKACGDDEGDGMRGDEGGWHAGMMIFITVIPASEPGSPKQSGSAQIVFYGDPRSKACGDDEGDGM